MNSRIFALCLPLVVLSAQQNAILMAIPPFLDAQGYSAAAIGALSSIPPLLTLAARMPGGMMYRTRGAKLMTALALLAVGLTSALFLIADSLAAFVIVSALNGFAVGVATTLYLPYFLDALPAGQARAQAMAWYMGVIALGFSLGGYLAGYVPDHWGFPSLFAATGLAAVAAIGLLLLGGRPADRQEAPQPLGAPAGPSGDYWLRRLLHPDVAMVLLIAVFLNMLYKVPATFIPVYAVAAGLTLTHVGMIMGAYALCNAVVRPLSGPWVERLGAQAILRFGLPAQAAVVMLIPLFQDVALLLAVAVGAGMLRAFGMVANTVAMTESMAEPRFSKGIASALFNAAADIGLIVGPLFGGVIAALVGTAQMFVLAPALVAAAFGLVLLALRRQPAAA